MFSYIYFFGERRAYPRNVEDSLQLNTRSLKRLKSLDSGTPSDIILVNHTCPKKQDPEKKGSEFLSKINGTKTKNGKIITISRPWKSGYGLGFKSFDYAFSKFKNDYDYWFFCEDDFTESAISNQYFTKAINQLKKLKDKNVAYLCALNGYIGGTIDRNKKITDDSHRKDLSCPVHCHGGIGCTHKDFLNVIVEKYGSLPYSKDQQYEECTGEVAFTNIFIQNGYNIAVIDH